MDIPEDTSIIEFVDNYFIRAGYTNTVLTNQTVRVIYSDVDNNEANAPGVMRSEISFDIYVKLQDLHNVGNDRLMFRTNLIANRLIHLLTKERYINGYRFWVAG